MKRISILTLTLLIAMASAAGARMNPVMLGGGVAASAADYSDITFHWNAENSWTTTKPPGGGAITGVPSETPGFSNTSPAVGGYSYVRSNAWESVRWAINSSHLDKAAGQVAFWYRFASAPSADFPLFRALYDANNLISVDTFFADGLKVAITWAGGGDWAYAFADYQLSVDTWYFIVAKWNVAAGVGVPKLMVSVYSAAGSLVASGEKTDAITALSADPTIITLNSRDGYGYGAVGAFNIDNVFVSDDVSRDMLAIRSESSYE